MLRESVYFCAICRYNQTNVDKRVFYHIVCIKSTVLA